MLTEAKIKRLTARPKAYRESDIPTLALVVQKTGRKTFIQRLTIHGKQEEIRIGDWPHVSLAEARKQADENRACAKSGRDPRHSVAEAMAIPTFAEAQEKLIALHRGNWREGGRTEEIWRREMDVYAGALLTLPVDQITVRHLENALAPIWSTKPEISKRLKQRCSLILKWAYAHGYRDGNPAELLDMILPKRKHTKRHHQALPFEQVGAALATLAAYQGAWWAEPAALRFAILTAARSGEVRGMRWQDVKGNLWTVPASRQKSGRDHKVVLSRQALAVLDQARENSDGSGLVFPSMTGKVQASHYLSRICRECGIDGTPHGFRSSFRNFAAEKTSFPRAVAELCLAHVNDNETEAAYLRTDMLQARAALLQQWADYVTGERGTVVRIA